MIARPCHRCGNPIPDGSYCQDCTVDPKTSARDRGYDRTWDRLSKRARKLQPWCTDCGTNNDLQADHSPQAWERKNQGLPIRLTDIDVVCGPCNRNRGAARQGTPTQKPWSGPRVKAQKALHSGLSTDTGGGEGA